MSSEKEAVKLGKMASSDHAKVAAGGVRHPWLPDPRDAFISWLRAEFAAANAIIDSMCHHLRGAGEPGEYEAVIECVVQRRVTWSPVLHMQQFVPCAEIMRALQQVESRRQQRAVDVARGKLGGGELGKSVVLDFGSGKVHRAVVNGRSLGFDCHSLKVNAPIVENRVGKERPNVPNATVDGCLDTSRNPDGGNIHYKESQLKDVKVEENLDSEAGCEGIPVTNDDHSIQNQNEENLTISPTINVAEGSNMCEEHVNQADNSMLISPVNEIIATGQRGQIPAIDSTDDIPDSGDDGANHSESVPTHTSESRTRWSHNEDLLLIQAWLHTDKVAAPDQKPKPFWNRVADNYCKVKPDMWVERGLNLCKCRWNRIAWPVSKFVGFYEEAYKQKARDQSEEDVLRKAHQLYYNAVGEYFSLDHAWYALRSKSKWRAIYLRVKAKDITEDSGCSAKRKKKKMDENEGSNDSDASLECDMMEDEESKVETEREKRKRKKEGEYLLAKKYDLLSNLIAQSGSLTSEEARFKSRLVEDLLKR